MNLGGTIRVNRTGICIIAAVCVLLMFYMSTDKSMSTADKSKPSNTNLVNLKKLLAASIEAASAGGREVVAVSKTTDFHVENKENTKEGAPSKLTSGDSQSHCVMVTGLRHAFPNIKIISEEHNIKCHKDTILIEDPDALFEAVKNVADEYVPAADITVWIDPLDATQEFTEHLFNYVTTMVCVAVKGKPTIGVIHKPFENKTSWAWLDKTTSKDLLQKPKDISIENPTIIISRSHSGEIDNVLKKDFDKDVKIIKAGGAGYKILEVAQGNATAYVHITAIKKWDICAGNAIISSLNGQMTTLKNDVIDYSNGDKVVNDKGLIAALYDHDAFIEKLKKTASTV